MNRRKSHWIVALLPVAGLLSGGFATAARAQSSEFDPNELDCVIEPRSVVKLGSAEEGILTEITVDRGDIVKRGDPVAKLNSQLEALAVDSARMQAERDVEIRSSNARYAYRKREADRAAELHRKKIVSTKIHDEAKIEKQLAAHGVAAAKMDRQMAELELKNAEERLNRRTIRSTVDGVVVEVTMSPGEFAHEQSPVMTIAQIDPLNVEVFVPISRYGTISPLMPAEVVPEDPVGGVYLGRVQVVDRVFDTASGTFGVRLELPNPDYKLPAGLKCRIRFLPPDQIAEEPEPPSEEPVVSPKAEAESAEPAKAEQAAVATLPSTDSSAPGDKLIYEIQTELAKAGYSTGRPDGFIGPRTRAAIAVYQQRHKLEVTGLPSDDLLGHMRRTAGSKTDQN